MWLPLLCVFTASLEAQQSLPKEDPRALLLEVRKKAMPTVE
jgi:hypothetical protein